MPSPLQYNGGLTIAIHVSSLAKALDWYQNVLGFTLIYALEEMGWAEVATEIEGVRVGLSQAEKKITGEGPVPTFGVDDLDAARTRLESQDVRFDGETQVIPGMVKLAGFFDPDGNALMLFEGLNEE